MVRCSIHGRRLAGPEKNKKNGTHHLTLKSNTRLKPSMESIIIQDPGPLGVQLGQNEHGVFVDAFDWRSALESSNTVACGDYICAVNGANVIGLSAHQVEELLSMESRPLRLGIVTKERLRAQNLLTKVDPEQSWSNAPSPLQPGGMEPNEPAWSPGAVTTADSMRQQYMDDFDSPLSSSKNPRSRGYEVSSPDRTAGVLPDRVPSGQAQALELDPNHVYDIVIERQGPLAVHLWQDEGGGVYVHDFQGIPGPIGETMGALEASGQVELGHYLIEINNISIQGLPLTSVVDKLRSTTNRPLRLKFWSKEPIHNRLPAADTSTHNISRALSESSMEDEDSYAQQTAAAAAAAPEEGNEEGYADSYCFFIVVDDEGPLAMHLWENSNGVYVHGFESVMNDNGMAARGPVEASGKVAIGDYLMRVGSLKVSEYPLSAAVGAIRNSSRPLRLGFIRGQAMEAEVVQIMMNEADVEEVQYSTHYTLYTILIHE
jgi:hypothetical protein